jgi:hypothetical protein
MLNNLSSPHDILAEVRSKGYVIFKDAFPLKYLKDMQDFWIAYYNDLKKFKNKDIYGGSRSIGDDNYNSYRNDHDVVMYRTTDFPWNFATHEPTRKLTNEMNRIRNLALGLVENHGQVYDPETEVLFNQINCYPANSGHMYAHTDTKSPKLLLSCMCNITFKTEHFQEGGLYLIIENKKVYIDDLMEPTSVIYYNGNLVHGVDKIVSNTGIGRIACYPMKQYFLLNTKLPSYLKFLIRVDNGIKRRFKLQKELKQGNSALIDY